MTRFVLAAALLCGCGILVSSGAAGEKKTPANTADGVWNAVAMEQNGMKLPDEVVAKLGIKLTLKGPNYTVSMNGQIVDRGTATADEKKKPKTVDIKSEDGPNKGKTILAILELNGDKLKACYDMEGKGRPTEFATKEGTGHVLIQYQREAKKKGD